MSLEKLKNETLTKLKTCKRESEVNEVLVETNQSLKESKNSVEERIQFWQERELKKYMPLVVENFNFF